MSIALDDPTLLGETDFDAEVVLEAGESDLPGCWMAVQVGEPWEDVDPGASFGFGQVDPFALGDGFPYKGGGAEVRAVDGSWHRWQAGTFTITALAEGHVQFTTTDAEICRGDQDGEPLPGDEAPCRSDVTWVLDVGSPEDPVQYEHCDRVANPIPELCAD